MGSGILEVDQHPEASGVDRVEAGVGGELSHGSIGKDAGRVAAAGPARPIAADDPDRHADEIGQRLGPRPDDPMPDAGPARGSGVSTASPSSTSPSTTVPSGKRSHSVVASGSVRRGDLDELEHDQLIDQAVGVVRQEEPSVLDDAELGQVDLGRVLEAEAANGGDREAGDARHGPMLADRHVPYSSFAPGRNHRTSKWRIASNALDALAPAVDVGVLERLPVALERTELEHHGRVTQRDVVGPRIGEVECPDAPDAVRDRPLADDDLLGPDAIDGDRHRSTLDRGRLVLR